MQGLDTERRVRPAIDRRSVASPSMLRDTRVDPLTGKQQPGPGPKVRRRVSEAAAPAVTGDDLAVEDEPSPESGERPLEIAR